MANQQISTNTFGVAKLVVSPDPTQGTHTTIADALAAAASGDTILLRDGAYFEDIVLKAGITIASISSFSATPNVSISGSVTFSENGNAIIQGVALTNTGNFSIIISGTSNSNLTLQDCYILASDHTAISISSSGAGLNLRYCFANVVNTGITLWECTALGGINVRNSSLIAVDGIPFSTSSSGAVAMYNSVSSVPISTSGTGWLLLSYTAFNTGNHTPIDLQGTNLSYFTHSNLSAGSAAAMNLGASAQVQMLNCSIVSANTSLITGSGNLNYSGLESQFTNGISGPTITAGCTLSGSISFDAGTNFLSHYSTGTYSPTIRGASTPGTTTYSSQVGSYTRIGNLVFVTGSVVWTAATGIGQLLLGSLPYNQLLVNTISYCYYDQGVATSTSIAFAGVASSSELAMIALNSVTGVSTAVLLEATGAAGGTITFTLTYQCVP